MFSENHVCLGSVEKLAQRLKNPETPVAFVLHVPDLDWLFFIAESFALSTDLALLGEQPLNLHPTLDLFLERGAALVSTSLDFNLKDPGFLLPVSSLPKLASTQALYMPPCDIAYTPGLFEGTLIKPDQPPWGTPSCRKVPCFDSLPPRIPLSPNRERPLLPRNPVQSANFGQVADSLRDLSSPVDFLLHVPNEAVLNAVSKTLHSAFVRAVRGEDVNLKAIVEDLFTVGEARLSPPGDPPLEDPSFGVDALGVLPLAPCRFCCQPPFHIVHTPGLFEGTLIQS